MASNDIAHFSTEELCSHLSDKVHESALLTLEKEAITGAIFTKLTNDDLKDLFPQVGARLSVSMVLRDIRKISAGTTPTHSVST